MRRTSRKDHARVSENSTDLVADGDPSLSRGKYQQLVCNIADIGGDYEVPVTIVTGMLMPVMVLSVMAVAVLWRLLQMDVRDMVSRMTMPNSGERSRSRRRIEKEQIR